MIGKQSPEKLTNLIQKLRSNREALLAEANDLKIELEKVQLAVDLEEDVSDAKLDKARLAWLEAENKIVKIESRIEAAQKQLEASLKAEKKDREDKRWKQFDKIAEERLKVAVEVQNIVKILQQSYKEMEKLNQDAIQVLDANGVRGAFPWHQSQFGQEYTETSFQILLAKSGMPHKLSLIDNPASLPNFLERIEEGTKYALQLKNVPDERRSS